MTCVFWICRHGRTEWNNENIRQGQKDSPLSSEGLAHANSLASHFSSIEGILYSSPLGRATATTNIIAEKNQSLSSVRPETPVFNGNPLILSIDKPAFWVDPDKPHRFPPEPRNDHGRLSALTRLEAHPTLDG